MKKDSRQTFEKLKRAFRHQPPSRIIAVSFVLLILWGAAMLCLPFSTKDGKGVDFLTALFTATSAATTTGLGVVNVGQTYSAFGLVICAILMQIGGIGVMAFGALMVIMMRRKMNLSTSIVFAESMNLNSRKTIVRFVRAVFVTTFSIELTGAAASFAVFVKDYPVAKALGLSFFHTIAAFNNAGMDALAGSSLFAYRDNVALNLITVGIMFGGGLGFLVIRELVDTRLNWRKMSMHSKVVLLMEALLCVVGMFVIKLSQYGNVSWLGAFFQAEAARMGGFTTYDLSTFSNAAIILIYVWMFVGCAPGSTSGGIRTTTLFVLGMRVYNYSFNKEAHAFRYTASADVYRKAGVALVLMLMTDMLGILLMTIFEPTIPLRDAAFECISAAGTVGMSTGITASLGVPARILIILLMFVGRVGPMTVATMWYQSSGRRVHYPEGDITVG
ncbi:MAG: H(+)-transporting ATPase [Clostridia bacterium]|nr:H(+)-transporting ATPase [Clostridia bacterium]